MRYLTLAIFLERQNHTCKPGDDVNKKIIDDRKYIENELKNDERGRLADAHRLNTLKQNYHVNDGDFAPIYWKKLLYARGWVLESPENGGGMP